MVAKLRFVLLFFCLFLIATINAQVRVYEGQEVIPTYKVGSNETSPVFYTGRGVQGAQGLVYPYPSQTKLSDSLVNVTYDFVYLENEYIKVKILPAFGGKLFSAIDKTNGHELFHTNSVIKPDLIGTLGAWISGGVEWCFPHHHRTTTMMKSDYRMVQNADGSATVWTGETEKTMRLRGVVGVTLRPGCSYVEVDYRLNNTNSTTNSFLFWANVAITSNKDFRTFWPPSQEIGVFHNNSSFIQWPKSNKTDDYGRTGYEEGVDLTWWKNHPNPVSFFMWHPKEGFIGGYDYGQKAGTVHVGDVYKNSASKLWQFGPGLQGQNARRKLTDDGKAYVELMTGTFSNNQPDYSWIMPHNVKDAKNYWYPLRAIEVVKNSTIDASVNLELKDAKTIFYGFNTTKLFKNAKILLKYNDEILVEKNIDIDPATPFTATFKSKKALDEYQLKIQLLDAQGIELVSYVPYKLQHPKLPAVQQEIKKPFEIESVEDLYLTGRFVEQFKRPGMNADEYYLAALKKSPTDYRVNLAMGIRKVGQTQYQEGIDYLQKAADKLQVLYFQPKEGELFYYLGLAQKELGQMDEAYKNLSRSTWYYEWFSAGNYQLALIESSKGNTVKALECIQNAYSTNNLDGRIIVLYSSLLREKGNSEKALELLNQLLNYDPLNFAALYEKSLIEGKSDFNQWQINMQEVDNNYLEIATIYLNAGLYADGIVLLNSIEKPSNPLIYYYLAWFHSQNGNKTKALEMISKAKLMSVEYCFPYRQESEKVLRNALKLDPENASVHYLLGNLLYNNRPKEAMAAWQKASGLTNSLPIIWRNLAFGAFYSQNKTNDAISYLKKAIELDPNNALWYAELFKYYDVSDVDFKECLTIYKNNIETIKKDILAPKAYVEFLNLNGEYDEAIQFMKTHHFRTWEGGREIYWYYVNSHTLKALDLIKESKFEEAISLLEKALLYPENLEVGKPGTDEKEAMIYYYLATAYKGMNATKKATEYFTKSAETKNKYKLYDMYYFQAKSYSELGNSAKANELFNDLIQNGKKFQESGGREILIAVEEDLQNDHKDLSYAYYLQGLGNKGLGQNEEAKRMFDLALKNHKNNLWAQTMSKN